MYRQRRNQIIISAAHDTGKKLQPTPSATQPPSANPNPTTPIVQPASLITEQEQHCTYFPLKIQCKHLFHKKVETIKIRLFQNRQPQSSLFQPLTILSTVYSSENVLIRCSSVRRQISKVSFFSATIYPSNP